MAAPSRRGRWSTPGAYIDDVPIDDAPDGLKRTAARRYTDQEVALVIKRAAELQVKEAQSAAAEERGLSLPELEQIAREAGLDPALVRRAATEIDTRHTTAGPSRFLGAPSILTLERTIDGEVPIEEYEPIVAEIRRVFNDVGFVSMLGRSFAWSSAGAQHGRHQRGGHVNITVSPRNGRTTIRVEESLRPVAGGLFGGIMGGAGGGTSGMTIAAGVGVFHSLAAGIGMWAVVLAGTYGLARTIFTRVARSRGERLQDVMERIAEHVAATAVKPAPLPQVSDEAV